MQPIKTVLNKINASPAQNQKSTTNNLRNSYKTYDWWPVQANWDGPKIDLSWHKDLQPAARAITYLSQSERGALILAGHPGCGKTLLSRIFLHSVGGEYRTLKDTETGGITSVWNAVLAAEPELLDHIRSSYGYEGGTTQLINKHANAEVLILDDLGAGYVKDGSGEWYNALMWRFLDKRKDKRTLITTNLPPAEFKDRVGERSFSRLKEVLGISGSGSKNIIDLFAVPDYRAKDW